MILADIFHTKETLKHGLISTQRLSTSKPTTAYDSDKRRFEERVTEGVAERIQYARHVRPPYQNLWVNNQR